MRRAICVLGVAVIGFISTRAVAVPVSYTFDMLHSSVAFYVNHLGFSNSLGQFKIDGGSFIFDNAKWEDSSVTVRIPVRSLNLGDRTWNAQVLGETWFDEAKFPEIVFTSAKLEKLDATRGKLYGTLTIKGVSKPVVLDLILNKVGLHPMLRMQAVGFSAQTVIKRSDFGMTGSLGAVGDQVDIRIEVEASVPPL